MSQKLQFLSVAVILLGALGVWLLQPSAAPDGESAGQRGGPGAGAGNRPPALVVTRSVGEAVINDRLSAVANGRAAASVTVVPLSAGVLTDVSVKSGATVSAGDVLARLDDQEEIIARDRAARSLKDANDDLARLESLFASRTSTEVELIGARAAFEDARLNLRDARLQLARRSIVAPIGGRIGLVPVEAGNYVTTQSTVATIDDRTTIELEFWVPERLAGAVQLEQPVEVTAFSNPGKPMRGVVSAIGSRVELDSRTLPVRATLDNSDERLRPGMSFEVALAFEGDRMPAIDPLAVQWDSGGSFVWQVAAGKAQRTPVRIVQRNSDAVLVAGELVIGDEIVTEGMLAIRSGAPVRVADAPRERNDAERPAHRDAETAEDVEPDT